MTARKTDGELREEWKTHSQGMLVAERVYTLDEMADWWLERRREDRERLRAEAGKISIIPESTPHHSPYISGVNEAADKFLNLLRD